MDKLLKQREALNQAVEEAETPDSSQMQTVSKAATGQKNTGYPKGAGYSERADDREQHAGKPLRKTKDQSGFGEKYRRTDKK